jgi:hypothetical protein
MKHKWLILLMGSALFAMACDLSSIVGQATAPATPTLVAVAPTVAPTNVPTQAPKSSPPPAATPTSAPKNSGVPTGFSLVVPAIADHSGDWGLHPSIVLTKTDDPMIAYLVRDPNATGNAEDIELDFVKWDRENGRWTKPITIDKVALFNGSSSMLQLAFDASANTLGIAYRKSDTEIWLALSTDAGATWKKELVSPTKDVSVFNPSLAMASGKTHIAYVTDEGGTTLHYLTRTGTGKFTDAKAPKFAAPVGGPITTQPQVAVNSQSRPAIAFLLSPATGYNTTVGFWRPGDAQAVKVTDSKDVQNDNAYISLAFAGDKPRIAINLSRGEKSGGPMYLISSEDGKTWAAPIQVPQEGNESMDGLFSLGISAQGAGAIIAPITGGNRDASVCGQPKLARSADLKTWETCSPDTTGKLGLSVPFASLVFDSKGKLFVVMQQTSEFSEVKPGLVVWREP